MLIDTAALKATALGYEKLYLFIFDQNLSVYYERLGFKNVGTDKFKSHVVTVMELRLLPIMRDM